MQIREKRKAATEVRRYVSSSAWASITNTRDRMGKQHLFLKGDWEVQAQAASGFGIGQDPASWPTESHLLLSPHVVREIIFPTSHKGTNPIGVGSTLWPNCFPPLNAITWGIRASTYDFGGTQTFDLDQYILQRKESSGEAKVTLSSPP